MQQRFADRDNFAILTISLDDPSTTPRLRDTIREHGINWPVLHVGAEDGWNDGSFDWVIHGVPTAFIITPDGNVLGEFWAGDDLNDTLDYLLSREEPLPAYGLDVSSVQQDDGTYEVAVKAISPLHLPVSVAFNAGQIVRKYYEKIDGEWVEFDPVPEGKEANSSSWEPLPEFEEVMLEFTFDEFGEAIQHVTVPEAVADNLMYVDFTALLLIPGTDYLSDGTGISIYARSEIWAEER